MGCRSRFFFNPAVSATVPASPKVHHSGKYHTRVTEGHLSENYRSRLDGRQAATTKQSVPDFDQSSVLHLIPVLTSFNLEISRNAFVGMWLKQNLDETLLSTGQLKLISLRHSSNFNRLR